MSNKLQQQLKPILMSLNSDNLLSLLASFKKIAPSRVYSNVRLVGFQCYEVRIQYKENITLGYGSDEKEAKCNCIKNFMEVMIEEPSILVQALKSMRDVNKSQEQDSKSTIDLRFESQEYDLIETSSIQSEKDDVLMDFVNPRNFCKPRKTLSSFKENVGMSTRGSVSRYSKEKETEISSCKENPRSCAYYKELCSIKKELEEQRAINTQLSSENDNLRSILIKSQTSQRKEITRSQDFEKPRIKDAYFKLFSGVPRQSKDSLKGKSESISETKRNFRSTSVDNAKKVQRNMGLEEYLQEKSRRVRESQIGFKSYETQATGRAMSSERKTIKKK